MAAIHRERSDPRHCIAGGGGLIKGMPPKKNPLNLNTLQLKTLTLLQELARLPGHSRPGEEPDSAVITSLPHPHGDHFHLGDALVASRDATGLRNPAVDR